MNTNESLEINNAVEKSCTPLISIIIPAYNASDFIEAALETIFRQPLNSVLFEVLVINDGSTDDTVEKVNRFKHKNNLKLFNIDNGGTGHARNIGIKESNGDFIIFLDADDLLLPNSLNDNLISGLKSYFECGIDIVYAPKYVSDINLQKKITVSYPEQVNKIRCHMPTIEFWSCIYRREYLINKKVYFFEYKEQDIETAFRYRAFSRTDNIVVDNKMGFYLHRDNPSSNVHTWKPLTLYYIKMKVYSELVSEIDNKLSKTDRGYLKYIEYISLSDYFRYINDYGFSHKYREQVEYMCDKIKQFRLSFREWLSLGVRNKFVYIKRKVKIRKITCFDTVIKLEKEEMSQPKKEIGTKDSTLEILQKWERLNHSNC